MIFFFNCPGNVLDFGKNLSLKNQKLSWNVLGFDQPCSGNLLLTFSEHFSQFISVTREKIDFKNQNVYIRDYSKFSNESFRDDVSIQYWNYTHENVHGLLKDFYSKLEGSVNRHAPLKKLSPKEIKIKSKPWLNGEISKMITIRNNVFKRKKRKPNNENCKCLYNLLRNRINRDLKKSKKQYYEQYFTEHVNNIKKTWDGILRKVLESPGISLQESCRDVSSHICFHLLTDLYYHNSMSRV